jgi:2-keto-4-pentenoate hydratase/2-oxohepta-3-ene-1,7-dioic acid hydratase in catechol pathway
MKLYRIRHGGHRWARETDSGLAPYSPVASLTQILSGDAQPDRGCVSLEEVTLLAPVEKPGKVVCVGVNYLDHCRETNTEPPGEPLLFAKFPSIVSASEETVAWRRDMTEQVDFEAELVAVIGDITRDVDAADALSYVAGYTCGNDLSARDLQLSDGQWIRGKNLDGFCALGPYLATSDEIPDPQDLAIECRVNGMQMQSSSTTEMIFGVAEIISFCSHHFTLHAGDVIMTGTPHGVALGREPSPWLGQGDVVAVSISGLGTLTTYCEER